MAREIKFRYWHSDLQQMWTCTKFMVEAHGQILDHFLEPLENGVLMQYTGLKDKNGKEIYEGDILQTDFAGSLVNDVMEYEVSVTGARWKQFLPLDRYEIIGNIYENPELMEE